MIFDSLSDFFDVSKEHYLYIVLQHKQLHGIWLGYFSLFSDGKPHACLCPALITWLLFPTFKNLSVFECSQRDLQFYPIVPIWTQQCWFTSPGMYQYTASMVRFHTHLLPTFFQVEGSWWHGKHCGGPLQRTTWGGISKARVGFLGNLYSASNATSWDLKTFFQGSPVLNRIDIEVLWCIQMLIYVSSKNKLLQY